MILLCKESVCWETFKLSHRLMKLACYISLVILQFTHKLSSSETANVKQKFDKYFVVCDACKEAIILEQWPVIICEGCILYHPNQNIRLKWTGFKKMYNILILRELCFFAGLSKIRFLLLKHNIMFLLQQIWHMIFERFWHTG